MPHSSLLYNPQRGAQCHPNPRCSSSGAHPNPSCHGLLSTSIPHRGHLSGLQLLLLPNSRVCLSTCLVPSLHIHGCFCPISTSCTHKAARTQPPPLSFRTLSTCTDSLKQSSQRGPFGLTSLSLSPSSQNRHHNQTCRSWSLLPLPRSSQAPPLSRSACSGFSPALSHPLSSHTCISTSADCQSRAGGDCVLFYR